MERIVVYGALCCWWDYIENAATGHIGRSGTLPCCPHCKGVLLQCDEDIWWRQVDEYSELTHDAYYRAFIEWLKGKCYSSIREARKAFERERTAQ